MRGWASEYPNLHYVPVLSAASGDAGWRSGWVHEAAVRDLGAELARHDVYVAGPPALVEAVRHGFPERGIEPQRIRFDSFDYAPR